MPTATIKRIREENQFTATILAFALIPLSGFAVDIYLPSMPQMGKSLHASSIQVQSTITIFLVSYGISQLFIGSLLDSFGRYHIGLWALIVFAISCLVIATTQNIYIFYAMRIVHGITVAAIIVAKRAFFVDMFSGDQLKSYLSMFTIVWSTGPILAPFFGGYLETAFGWQSNFYFLAAFSLVIALLELIFSGETLIEYSIFNFKKITGIYINMLATSSFTLGLLMLGLSYSMVMVFNMTGPFIIEHHLSFSPVIAGYCSLILGTAWMAGGFAGKATIRKPFYKKLFINLFLQIIFISTMLVSLNFQMNLYTLIFFAFIIHVTAGFTFNNYFSYCLGLFPKNAGIASGLSGGVNYIIVSLLSYGIVYFIPASDEKNLAYSYLVLILLSVLVMFFVYKINRKK
jgi:DHA1 family bicyclomycin/chloramphenicol resistance-like MFS transporter